VIGLPIWIENLRNDGDFPVKGLWLVIGTCVLLASPAVDARDPRFGFGLLAQAQGQPMPKDRGRFQQRGAQDKQGVHDKRNQGGRLTQEERKDLHRDLDRANREIYRRR
jgi:hypothetical protein